MNRKEQQRVMVLNQVERGKLTGVPIKVLHRVGWRRYTRVHILSRGRGTRAAAQLLDPALAGGLGEARNLDVLLVMLLFRG